MKPSKRLPRLRANGSPAGKRTWGIWLIFLLNGFVAATWLPRIPEVQGSLGLTLGMFGFALTGTPTGTICANPLARFLLKRFGSRGATLVAAVLYCVAIVGPGAANSVLTLWGALFALGGANICLDVAEATHAARISARTGREIRLGLEAMLSVGWFFGSSLGDGLAGIRVNVELSLAITCAIGIAATALASRGLVTEDRCEEQAEARPWSFNPIAALRNTPPQLRKLTVLAFFALLCEGAMLDWSSVFLSRVFHSSPAAAGFGVIGFTIAMAAGQGVAHLLGLTERLGPSRVVVLGAAIAAAGVLAVIFSPFYAVALAGFIVIGIGLSPANALASDVASRMYEETGAATVALGYVGFLAGPPIIGLLSQLSSLRVGLVVILLVAGGILILAPALGREVLPSE